jgi:hypothetical protein
MFTPAVGWVETVIHILDDLQAKTPKEMSLRRRISGVGARAIYSALQRSHGARVKYWDLFNAMCTSVESLSIFRFEGADAADVYFSLRGPKDEMLEICRRIPTRQPFDVAQFQVSCVRVDLPNFNRLMRRAEELTGACADLEARNQELQRRTRELEEDKLLLSNPAELRRQVAEAHEACARRARV